MRRGAYLLAVAAALLPSPTSAEPSHNPADYVILAGEELIARRLIVEAGDVGVNSGFLQSKKGVEGPSSRFVADQVRIGDRSRCLELSGNHVVQTGSACQLAAGFEGPLFPSLAEACGFPTSPTACDPSRPVQVVHRETEVLPPGAYGDVSVAGGSPGRGTLVLEGGAYSFCSLHLGPRARFNVRGPSTVYVVGRVNLGLGTVTGPAVGSNLDPTDIQLFVAGDKARFQRRAQLTGLICAPNGLLHVNDGGRLVGRGVGQTVRVGRVTVRGVAGGGPTTTLAPSTSTSTSSTTSTSLAASTTSTTSTTSTSVQLDTTSTSSPLPSTTSTSTSSSTSSTGVDPTTSSTSSSVVTTTSTTSTISSAVCGNGMVEVPETCDDENTLDGDFCPSNCIIETCNDPQFDGARRNVDISVNATLGTGQKLGTVRVLFDYPEGVVMIPGSADGVGTSLTMAPAGANCIPNDLDYALLQGCLSFSGYNPGLFSRVAFVTCGGAPAPTAGDFGCTILEATDQIGANITATCTVTLP